MKTIIKLVLILVLLGTLPFIIKPSRITQEGITPIVKIEVPNQVVKNSKEDKRVTILRDYLAQFNSPLVPHAQDFVEAADLYEMDWRLVPAIAGVESTFGKHIPGGQNPATISYNGWGWGVYGTQSLGFKSWRHGIFTVSEGLKKNYINRGLTNPLAMNRVYASSPTWGVRVNYFLDDIDRFTKKHPLYNQLAESPSQQVNVVINDGQGTVSYSGKLASN